MDRQMQLIDLLAKTRSTNQKREILHHVFPRVLYQALSPNVRFYMKAPNVVGTGTNFIDQTGWKILGLLSARNLTGNKAKDIVRSYMKLLTPKSAELYRRILNKDLRAGVGAKLVNSVHPNLIEESWVMLAEDYDVSRLEFPCYVSFKVDGNRAPLVGKQFFSRTGKLIIGYDSLVSEIRQLIPSFDLDGELRDVSTTFQKSSGAVRRTKNVENKKGIFFIFDVIEKGWTADTRYAMLNSFNRSGNVRIVPHTLVHNVEQIDTYYDKALELGFEGLVIKKREHLYHPGRSWDWIKRKPDEEVDLVVEELIEGEGKWKGTLAAVIVERARCEVRVTAAMSDPLRKYYWEHPEEILGRFIKVIYQNETDDGSLRHPRFKVVRTDK